MTQYLLGIDLGAGSLKVAVITGSGQLAGSASRTIATEIARPGWAEQDPAAWVEAMQSAIPAAVAEAGIRASAIAGIGICAGAHTAVLTDAAGQVIRPAILWSDQRSTAEAEALHAGAGDLIIRTALNRVNPTWTLAMLAWLQNNEPAAVARTDRLYLAKDFLRHQLTGTWETDFSDAIGTLLADAAAETWSTALCGLIGWNMKTLPPVRGAGEVVGRVTPQAAAATGLAVGTRVVCGTNDTTAEFFGIGAIVPGMASVKLATAGVLSLATAGPRVCPPVSCYPHVVPGLYYAATGTNSCASAHCWLRDTMFAEGGFPLMDRLAASLPPGSGGLLFHPYLQGERAPYWDAKLRGDFIGLTMSHTPAHFARALYEGIAYSIRDLLEAAEALGFGFGTLRLLGGGARSDLWRRIIADVTGHEVQRMESGDAAFGAALLAGIGAGVFAGPEDAVLKCVQLRDSIAPDPAAHERYGKYFEIYKAAQAALAPVNHRLYALGDEPSLEGSGA